MASQTWMADTPAIHKSLLRNICLPATHDSGTNALQDFMSPQYGEWVADLVNLIEELAAALDEIPWLNRLINPAAWLIGAAIPAVRGLATATSRSITQQLYDGIRCLDLRICYFEPDKDFYTYHGLLGSKMTDVLNEIKAFLQATDGEIVYVTMGHWKGFNSSLYNTFAAQVKNALGNMAYVPVYDGDAIQNNVFEQTYEAIVGTPSQSRVILVFGPAADAPSMANTIFWPPGYSPPDNGPQEKNPDAATVIDGYYSNTTDLSTMLQAQQEQQQDATLPFALYMTLTPDGADYADVVVTSLAGTIAKLSVAVFAIPFIGGLLFLAIECIAAGLYIGQLTFSWRTLQQLSATVDDQLTELVYKNFAPPGKPNNISFLYVDYYETTHVVALAVSLSLANAADSVPQLPIVLINQYSSTMNGVMRYAFGTSMGYGWALVESGVFRGYSAESGASGASGEQSGPPAAVYSYYQNNGAWNLMLSTSQTTPNPGWLSNGIAFYAFNNPEPWLVPIYQYSKPDPSGTFSILYFYSPSAQVAGWGSPTVVFYAMSPFLQPVYALQTSTSGQTRYSWSMINTGGTGWGPGSPVFRGATVPVGNSVALGEFYQIVANGGAWNFALGTGDPPAGFAFSNPVCYVFSKRQPGVAPIREFTKELANFGTIYQYLPVARLDGWTAGPIVFYAALPNPPASPLKNLDVLDLGLLASAGPPSSGA